MVTLANPEYKLQLCIIMAKATSNDNTTAVRIFINNDDYEFIKSLSSEGVTIQRFVSDAIEDKVFRMRYKLAIEEESNKLR